MKLYFAPRTRAIRPRWLLEELGVPYELVTLDMGEGDHKQPAHLALHPLGKVPVLVDGDVTVYESLAICLYLADKYIDNGLAPAFDAPERGAYYQWMVYSIGTMEPAIFGVFTAKAKHDGDMEHAEVKAAQAAFGDIAAVVEKALDGRPYLVGDRLTAADVMVGSMIGWAAMQGLYQPTAGQGAYIGGLSSRPAFQKAVS